MKRLSIALLAFAMAVPAAFGATDKPLHTLWQAAVEDNSEFEAKSSVIAPDGTVWMLVNAREKGRFAGPDRQIELRGVDRTGKQVASVDVSFSLDTTVKEASLTEPYDIAVDKNGAIVVFAGNHKGELHAVGFDPKSEHVLFDRKLTTIDGDFFINRVVPAAGAFFIVGRQYDRGLALKVSADFSLIWKKNFENEPPTIITDAAVDADGSFILGGTVTGAGGRVSMWLGAFTAEGSMVASTVVPGREARLGTDGAGHYAVLHDVRGSSAWQIWLAGFGADLKPRWTVQLADGLEMPPTFSLARSGGNWFAAVPTSPSLVTIAEVREGGEIANRSFPPPANSKYERVWNVNSLSLSGGDLVLPYTVVTVNGKGEMRQSISVVRLSRRSS